MTDVTAYLQLDFRASTEDAGRQIIEAARAAAEEELRQKTHRDPVACVRLIVEIEPNTTTVNRRFLQILREVRRGESTFVTYRGEPVAVMSPIEQGPQAGQQAAKGALLERLRKQIVVDVFWRRDELYTR